MARGGKREGSGRKAQGVTRKVSLTLTQEEWDAIEALNMKLVTFIKGSIATANEIKRESSYKILYEASESSASKFVKEFGKLQGRIDLAIEEFCELNSRPLPSQPSKRVEELERRLDWASKKFDKSYFYR